MKTDLRRIVENGGGREFAVGMPDRGGVMVMGIQQVGSFVTVKLDPAVPGGRPRGIVKHVNDLCVREPWCY